MTQDVLDTFCGGKPLETQTAARTHYRGMRRLRERHLLRRERLHRVLNTLGFLPDHYAQKIDFVNHFGQCILLDR
jgi:CRISPR-associated endonuclease Csn1